MKKLCVVVAMVVSAGVWVMPAEAKPSRSTRVVQESYSEPQFWPLSANCLEQRGCVSFFPRYSERSISIDVEDEVGGRPYFYIYQDVDGDGFGDIPDDLAAVCGRTDRAVPIRPGIRVDIFVNFAAPDHCGAEIGWKGIVTARLLDRKAP